MPTVEGRNMKRLNHGGSQKATVGPACLGAGLVLVASSEVAVLVYMVEVKRQAGFRWRPALYCIAKRRAAWLMHVFTTCTEYGVVRPQRSRISRVAGHGPLFALPLNDTNKIAALVGYTDALPC